MKSFQSQLIHKKKAVLRSTLSSSSLPYPYIKPFPAFQDELFDGGHAATPTTGATANGSAGGGGSLYESLRGQAGGGSTAAAVLENIQAQLKLREGEMVQLQMELGQVERSRDNLSAEVTRLTVRLDKLEGVEEELETTRKAFKDTQQKYQTMLTVRKKTGYIAWLNLKVAIGPCIDCLGRKSLYTSIRVEAAMVAQVG